MNHDGNYYEGGLHPSKQNGNCAAKNVNLFPQQIINITQKKQNQNYYNKEKKKN